MKILFLSSNPLSTSQLSLEEEAEEIEEGLKRSKLADKFKFIQRWAVRPRDLRRALLEENPDIVHFSGHGKGSAGLVLVDKAGQPKPATGEALVGLFIQFPCIKCVLLNACYTEVQAQAIVQHVDYVIGMKNTILDDAAISFTTGFYDGLGYGRNIEDAFELGCNAILWELSSFSNKTRQMIPVDFTNTENKSTLPENLKPILLKKLVNFNPHISFSNEVKMANSPQTSSKNYIQLYRDRIQNYLSGRITKEAEVFSEDLGKGVTLEMVSIPGGEFLMGTDDEEIARLCKIHDIEWFHCERPQHKVNIPSFLMGRYPVTQSQWQVVASMNKVSRDLEPKPSHFQDDNLPVEKVCWNDAVEFCARLSNRTGLDYRLPSEAEWEYTCRAGTNTPFYFGATITTNLANYRGSDWDYGDKVYSGNFAKEPKGEYRKETTEVGIFPPNAFGLYDMHGNLWEWCADDWHKNYDGAPHDGSAWSLKTSNHKIIRGGSWLNEPHVCRSAVRFSFPRDLRSNNIGFRIACVALRAT
ncbi:SUMF1/EgtB/PvdO family nonheme iron enzyme [Pleurocapsa sp. PCC 7319]|uniref:SUMF1/EgtB/PvdO family nonheme iron enzyme n=1 Tax=Pleurocapsa sp. PCC 7319 TaxID=118161 RepID=UPI00036723DC|nr:SUMF1/EgtB/PvdO family nonheme iron enzyme [Pleurocapsa sp. PCC 7319]